MKRTIASTLALCLTLAACAGEGEASTTTGASSTTSVDQATTTTGGQGTTTSEATNTTDSQPPATLPPVIAAAVFDFTGGAGSVLITVAVGESAGGPFFPAGFSAESVPQLGSARYWVQFTVENLDQLNGTVVGLEISGFDGSDLGEDVCSLDPIPVGGSATCVAGGDEGFAVELGVQNHEYFVTAEAERQGYPPDRWIQPPVPTSLGYQGARHSFVLSFELSETEGARIDGTANAASVQIEVPGPRLSSPVTVDCSDDFPDGFSSTGGSPTPDETPLVAYVIENFSAGGDSDGGCARIPTGIIEMDVEGDNSGYQYEGVDLGST
jgi:hypothetical protein